MTPYTFCTLFDKNYLHQGIALYTSLARHTKNFTLWILCMDEDTFTILKRMQFPFVHLIQLTMIETEKLQKCKRSRTAVEYCWTCKPALIRYIFALDPACSLVTYLDADLFFFHSPHPIYSAFNNHSIGITPHHFQGTQKRMEETAGKYNAGFLMFRRDTNGIQCLKWYYKECLIWCYFRHKNGKIGDQGYLDMFLKRFSDVYTFEHTGINTGPWNITNYNVTMQGEDVLIDQQPLICYHFHSFKMFSEILYEPCSPGYKIRTSDLAIYKLYYKAISSEISRIKTIDPSFTSHLRPKPSLFDKIKRQFTTRASSLLASVKKSKL